MKSIDPPGDVSRGSDTLPVEPMRYGLEERPPLPRSLLYAVQWVLIVVPFIAVTSNIMAAFLGLTAAESVAQFQKFCLVTGIVTAAQVLFGHRYPLIDGPSAALLLSAAVLAGRGLPSVSGGMLAGGLVLLVLGGFGLVGRVRRLFTDPVVGVVLILISTTLLPLLYPMVFGISAEHPKGDPSVLILSHGVIIIIILLSYWAKGTIRTLSVFLGILAGTLGMAALGRLDVAGVGNMAWVALPRPFLGPRPEFALPAVISLSLAYVAVIVNGLGSYLAAAEVTEKEGLSGRIERGVALTGVGGLLAGAFGVVGTVSYSLSPGVILITRVASRWPVFLCGLALVALAFFQKAGAFLAAVPEAVVGAALVVSLGAQIGVGITVATRGGIGLGVRESLVVGIPVILGTTAAILPASTLDLFIPSVRALMGNGLIVGMVTALLLEHVVLRKKD